jgi:hypothetical protein
LPWSVTRRSDAQSFAWDKAGNQTSHVRQGAANTCASLAGSNRLASISAAQARSFGYDPNAVGEFLNASLACEKGSRSAGKCGRIPA